MASLEIASDELGPLTRLELAKPHGEACGEAALPLELELSVEELSLELELDELLDKSGWLAAAVLVADLDKPIPPEMGGGCAARLSKPAELVDLLWTAVSNLIFDIILQLGPSLHPAHSARTWRTRGGREAPLSRLPS